MTKKTTKRGTSVSLKRRGGGAARLVAEVRELILHARKAAASTVNTLQVLTNFEIGRRIVEHEQKGEKRAEYGAEVLKELSARLTEEFGRGFSKANLEYMRRFFLEWRHRDARIAQTASGQSATSNIHPMPAERCTSPGIAQTPSGQSAATPFTLSWSHYVLLMTIRDPDERAFYEIETSNQGWSLSELRRQKASALYGRLALSRDKEGIRKKLIEWAQEAGA